MKKSHKPKLSNFGCHPNDIETTMGWMRRAVDECDQNALDDLFWKIREQIDLLESVMTQELVEVKRGKTIRLEAWFENADENELAPYRGHHIAWVDRKGVIAAAKTSEALHNKVLKLDPQATGLLYAFVPRTL